MWHIRTALTVVIITTFIFNGDGFIKSAFTGSSELEYGVAEAKSRSSSRSSRSSFSSKSSRKSSTSSWGRSKPAKKSKAVKRKPTKTTKKVVKKKPQKPGKKVVKKPTRPQKPGKKVVSKPKKPSQVKKPPQGTFAKTVDKSRSKKALAKRNDNAKKARQNNVVAKNATASGKKYSHDSVRKTRNSYYKGRSNTVNVQRSVEYTSGLSGRNYGGFDPTFLMLTMMSDDPGSTALWYGLTGSPMMAIMMSDFRKEAKTNNDPELLARLDAVEADNARLKSQGVVPVAVDKTLSKMGVPTSVALTEDVLTGEALPILRFTSGGTEGDYYPWCMSMRKVLDGVVDVQCATSAGGQQNIERFCLGKSDAMLAQSDTISQNADVCSIGKYQKPAYPEFVYLMTNRDQKADSIKDMPKGTTLYVGMKGSGTAKAWDRIVEEDPSRYGKKRFEPKNAKYEDAIKIVAEKKSTAMLYVSSLGSNLMHDIDTKYGDHVQLTAVDDWDFDDAKDAEGNKIYDFYNIPEGTYPTLQKSSGFLGSSQEDRKTLTVTAVFAMSESWVNKYGEETAGNVLAAINWINQ